MSNLGFSQETKTDLKTYDPELVGCWKGSEVDQQKKGLSKYWVSCRFADGKSVLLFVAVKENGDVVQETENGKWWTENGKYYELHSIDGVTDIYNYKVTAEGVDFQSIEIMREINNSYKFTDYKIDED